MQNWPSAAEIIDALHLIQADFDGRPTHQVTGKGGKLFEFFPTSITDNIPPLHPKVSRAICLISQLHLEHAAEATLGVGEEDRGAMIISDILLSLNLPRTLARWTPTGAPGEVQVPLSNEYIQEGQTQIFLNGVRAHDRVLIIDDLISTNGRDFIARQTGHVVKTILATSLEKRDGRINSKLVRFHLGRLPSAIFHEVASAFPPGLCQLGSGN
jgi:adenine phosphoribosyltransferase